MVQVPWEDFLTRQLKIRLQSHFPLVSKALQLLSQGMCYPFDSCLHRTGMRSKDRYGV